jgi:hypothetical protein
MLCYVQNYPGTSLLEQSLFRKFVGPLSVIAVIASFLSFSRNVDLQLASAKMLTSLCISAQKARPHPISIASYVTFPEQVFWHNPSHQKFTMIIVLLYLCLNSNRKELQRHDVSDKFLNLSICRGRSFALQ